MSEEEARKNYPDLLQIIEEKVKPERLKQKREIRKRYWWRFGETTPALFRAIAPLKRVLVTNAQASTHLSFIFYSSQVVFANSLNIFPFDNHSTFTILQSRIHEIFARFFSSSIKDDLRYNPSDCFETFPFPLTFNKSPLEPTLQLGNTVNLSNCSVSTEREKELEKSLEEIGKIYYEYRAQIMIENNQGLTDTYNRFHDPEEQDPAILKLRELHDQMDRVVLDAYGWTDIQPTCEFLLDYEEDDEDENDSFILSQGNGKGTNKGGKRHKKKPWRYRWNEEIHDEILARLLDLNQQRYEEENLSGETATSKKKSNNVTPKIPGI
jgi:hypothetical protein